jgi:uncharacterized protein YbjT (DUF2867 family)
MDRPITSVLVTGAAGLLGQQTVRSLAIRGRSVLALYRSKIPETMENVFPLSHDLALLDGLGTSLRNVETVIHLAWNGGLVGATDGSDIGKCDSESTSENILIMKNLIRNMEIAGVKRIVFVSALGASPKSESIFLREKYIAEHLILNSQIKEKIILRSTIVWSERGENDPFLRAIMKILKYPFYPLPSKSACLSPIHARDIARIIAESAICPIKDTAGYLEIKGIESLPLSEICKIVSERYVGKPRFPIRGTLGKALLPFVEREKKVSQRMPKLANFLAISGSLGEAAAIDNPLRTLIEGKFASFREQ